MVLNNNTCCIIFSKTPEVGKTKTRLIPALGEVGANNLHVKLLKHCLKTIKNVQNIDIQLHYTNSPNISTIRNLANDHRIKIKKQVGRDLGKRMYHASLEVLSIYSHCIIIGTDCPDMSPEYIESALQRLTFGYDIVLGPANDGGYVLIGLNRTCVELFTGIQWGSSAVLRQTKQKISGLNWSMTELDSKQDIDTENDLTHLKNIKLND